uniref:ATP synthase F0 subunit 8 n=1 Tax=Amblyomma dubitatum TaxID=321419 RepID=UPI002E7A7C50|nr:ATP synthase F0 subunit 8 [Amblyomma dubitatum]WQF69007.1 ATP synthase F0 subunit 8 [Amblyomma dubitatum]
MPQLFPMNWMMLTLITITLLILLTINIYFFKMKNKLINNNKTLKNQFLLFKW